LNERVSVQGVFDVGEEETVLRETGGTHQRPSRRQAREKTREKKKNAASFADVKLNYEFLEVLTGSIR
jgi:hypothetical protein